MENKKYTLSFVGEGFDYFKLQLVNLILTIITFGLYYPWAKASVLKYLYGQTVFEDQPFVFSGTGKEMFKGFIKAFAVFIILYAAFLLFVLNEAPWAGFLFIYVSLLVLVPFAVHGAYKYRFAKTTWSGIRFGYHGQSGEFIKLFFTGFFLTIITLGIYSPWFIVSIRKYLISNIKVGDAGFSYSGKGIDYLLINLKGYVLTLLTLGIYSFWWQKSLLAFYVDHLHLSKDEQTIKFKSTATAGGIFTLTIVNLLLLIFTLGIAAPWVIVRSLAFVMRSIELTGTIDLNTLLQEQEAYNNAAGDDIADSLDIGLVI